MGWVKSGCETFLNMSRFSIGKFLLQFEPFPAPFISLIIEDISITCKEKFLKTVEYEWGPLIGYYICVVLSVYVYGSDRNHAEHQLNHSFDSMNVIHAFLNII